MKVVHLFFTLFLCSFFLLTVSGQHNFPANTYDRETLSLNGRWKVIVDPIEVGFYDYRIEQIDQYGKPGTSHEGFYATRDQIDARRWIEWAFTDASSLLVPGDWNTQDDKLFYYEGTLWYRKEFDYAKKDADSRIYVHFGASNYRTDVYLNGTKLGYHEGGFTPFSFDVTTYLQEEDNWLVVKVDNKRHQDAVPTILFDWWNYGGITRDVKIVEVPSVHISDYEIQLAQGNLNQIEGFVRLSQPLVQQVEVVIPELKKTISLTTDDRGYATISEPLRNISYWEPDNPKLYSVEIRSGYDVIQEKIGFRTIQVQGTDILLNGKPVFLRGISIHEENPFSGGRVYAREEARMLINWAQELHCNYIRLAHYPHNEHMIRLADEMGMLVWEEIPVYWAVSFDNEDTYQNAKQQLSSIIKRDRNRASVIIWSMANETPVSEQRNVFLKRLVDHTRKMDDTRLISAALEKHADVKDPHRLIVEDPFAKHCDIVSFNQYVGWYDGVSAKCDSVSWHIPYNKPVVISEFGGGAVAGNYGDSLTVYTEEYQEDMYRRTLKMLDRIPQLRGISPWILVDFRSPRRLKPMMLDGYNRKGLIAPNGHRKKAFYVLQQYYLQKKQAAK